MAAPLFQSTCLGSSVAPQWPLLRPNPPARVARESRKGGVGPRAEPGWCCSAARRAAPFAGRCPRRVRVGRCRCTRG
eukprot:14495788-Alexandrium_andersonii.AAC.1